VRWWARLALWNRRRSRPKEIDLSKALVVFACSPEEAESVDVAVGPCVPRIGPRGGRRRPLASPKSQTYSDTFDHLTALHTLLTGRPATEALEGRRSAGSGTMARLSNSFVDSLAPIGQPSGDPEQMLARHRAIAESWLTATTWPSPMQTGGLETRLLKLTNICRQASENGLSVYAWQGDSVPEYAIAHGVGAESFQEYRRRAKH
jgi:hypothetical protein